MQGDLDNAAAPLEELIEELRTALEDERRALLSGSAEAINHTTHRKMLIADRIEQTTILLGAARPSPATLQPLVRYNQENAVICAAMLRHLTGAIDRLRRYDPHRSYTSDGDERSSAAQHALGAA
jgi:flagellar biosynthesis/type III secretory pathway chaperone